VHGPKFFFNVKLSVYNVYGARYCGHNLKINLPLGSVTWGFTLRLGDVLTEKGSEILLCDSLSNLTSRESHVSAIACNPINFCADVQACWRVVPGVTSNSARRFWWSGTAHSQSFCSDNLVSCWQKVILLWSLFIAWSVMILWIFTAFKWCEYALPGNWQFYQYSLHCKWWFCEYSLHLSDVNMHCLVTGSFINIHCVVSDDFVKSKWLSSGVWRCVVGCVPMFQRNLLPPSSQKTVIFLVTIIRISNLIPSEILLSVYITLFIYQT
jgi:hypothetical protein